MANQKWVFVTGGTRGIGAGIVKRLANAGYSVAFSYRSSDESATALERECADGERWCKGFRCDMSSHDAVRQLSETLYADHGAPYAVINNAGITRDALIFMMGPDKWNDVIRNNLDSVYHATHAFVPKMAENKDGCLINISSVSAIKGNAGQANYAATKAAMIGMAKSLAIELGRFNLRVNTVAPGLIATEMTQEMGDAQKKKLLSHIPLRRLGSIDDVAAMVEFLLGDGGRYVTGQTFVIDGGLTA